MPETPRVLHVISPRHDPLRAETVRWLRKSAGEAAPVLLLGRDAAATAIEPPLARATAAFSWSVRGVLKRTLAHSGARLLHAWSSEALPALVAAWRDAAAAAPLLLDLDAPICRRLAGGLVPALNAGGPWGVAAPSDAARRTWLAAGASPERVALIRPALDFAALCPQDRVALRAALRLDEDHVAALVLPPVTHAMDAHYAVWGALLAERVDARIRLLVPGSGAAVRRAMRFVAGSNRRSHGRWPGDSLTLFQLLSAADLCLYMPPGPAPMHAVAAALAAGKPIVARATPTTTEWLVHGVNAFLTRTQQPRDVARRVLEVIENRDEAWRRSETGRMLAFRTLSRQRLIEQYQRVHANLLSGRTAADGVHDALAVIG